MMRSCGIAMRKVPRCSITKKFEGHRRDQAQEDTSPNGSFQRTAQLFLPLLLHVNRALRPWPELGLAAAAGMKHSLLILAFVWRHGTTATSSELHSARLQDALSFQRSAPFQFPFIILIDVRPHHERYSMLY